jgi:excisionase family DNA binding protein
MVAFPLTLDTIIETGDSVCITPLGIEGEFVDPNYLEVSDVAEFLKVGQSKVRSWVKAGKLKAANVGTPKDINDGKKRKRIRNRWIILRADLDEFLRTLQSTVQRTVEMPRSSRRRRDNVEDIIRFF